MKRAFVLSGGGSLGAMQIGALRLLLEKNITPDIVVGCSAGALNASFLAIAPTLGEIERAEQVWRNVTTDRVYPGSKLQVFWRLITGQDSLYDNRRFYAFLQESGCSPSLTFGDLRGARLYVTAMHLTTGRLHVFGDNPHDLVLDALMASTALTPLHPPWEINGERYVDGGTVTPLPLRVALERGATEIYALHLHRPNAEPLQKRLRGVADHINHAVSTMLRQQADHDLHLAEAARRVRLHYLPLWTDDPIEPTDFSHSAALIEQGYERAAALMQKGDSATLVNGETAGAPWWRQWMHLFLGQQRRNQMSKA
ncbi:patatin-like phospholipase family protein [Caldilinea sp.]|jgi:NTE family protein|uniref:patatin-like phospholipase family protein n=1 Tax=Caldilinea sp. TaxID=2293560 RepID=UPI002628ECF1|nr:patatin-like phospholipase family protein [uncultured Caldilinea sp.]